MDNSWNNFSETPVFIPSCVVMGLFVVICLLNILKKVAGRNEMNSDSSTADVMPETTPAATAPPQSTATGLDESKINSCTELVVISKNRINPGPDSNICCICLESYKPLQTVRSIAKCDHCFHADCIELWLRKNRTCPVCRTILATVEL